MGGPQNWDDSELKRAVIGGLRAAATERPPLRAYAFALALVSLALAGTIPLAPIVGPNLTLLFTLAVMVAAWHGGLWPGLFATLVSIIGLRLHVVTRNSSELTNFFVIVLFATTAFVISSLNALRKRAESELRREHAELEELVEERTRHLRQEISVRRRAEETLADSEARYRDLFEDAPVAYHEIDDQGVVRRVNAAECELLGRKPHEILRKPVWDLVAPSQREISRQSVLAKVRGELPIAVFTREFIHPEGRTMILEIREKRILDSAGKIIGIRSSLQDVTERFRAEEHARCLQLELESKVRERTADLERSNEALQQFAYSASHDLQEPLRIVSSYAELLNRRYGDKLDTDAREFLDFIVDGTSRMSTLIRDLLAFSRAGQTEGAPRAVDMHQVVETAVRNLEAAFEETGATLCVGELPTLNTREAGLSQVLQNLIANAIKYRNSSHPEITITAEEGEQDWTFCVADNGQGFHPQYADRIFGIFKRLHGREYPGTGIGLAICRRVIQTAGGRIWAESEPGSGSRFYFTLPKKL